MIEGQTRVRRGPPRGSIRSETRGEIVRHAERVFAEVGFSGSSLDMIADVVGIRRPSVLHHFRSKREIYDCVEQSIIEELAARTEQRSSRGTPFERMTGLIDTWLDFMIERPTAARIMARNSSDLTSRAPDPVQFSERILLLFEAIVDEGRACGAFGPVEPMMALNILGAGIINYVCNAGQLGEARRYDFADPARIARYRGLLHRTARTLLLPDG
ncbi:TetR/AcrR family transcriptional regulator [Flavisphingomonas formosensis]|uniref:TetR/AcrR family transcriptional regulator n=1 Tax=Flavisphingomonas formosensis TaxID=861534 RepID=UPI0012FCA058|nr:TetR/AcrR family transcriptional regulator [Sphingomonas formosensis]